MSRNPFLDPQYGNGMTKAPQDSASNKMADDIFVSLFIVDTRTRPTRACMRDVFAPRVHKGLAHFNKMPLAFPGSQRLIHVTLRHGSEAPPILRTVC